MYQRLPQSIANDSSCNTWPLQLLPLLLAFLVYITNHAAINLHLKTSHFIKHLPLVRDIATRIYLNILEELTCKPNHMTHKRMI